MSHDVFVTRAAHHFDGGQVPIPEGDWRAVIEKDPDLWSPDTAVPSFARWGGPSSLPEPWIDWAGGNLFTRNPDDSFLRKLLELAGRLGATVQGADGSRYRLEGDHVVRHPPAREAAVDTGDRGRGDPDDPIRTEVEPSSGGGESLPERLRTSIAHESHHDAEPVGMDLPAAAPAAPAPEAREADASFAVRTDELIGPDHPDHRPTPRGTAPFRIGQRVRTSWGRPATVIDVDPDVDWGMGHIEIKYDDGRTATMSCTAHGLEPM